MAKRAREQAVWERRERKQAKRAEAAAARAAAKAAPWWFTFNGGQILSLCPRTDAWWEMS